MADFTSFSLEGKTAVLIGGGGAIGMAAARGLGRVGAHVVVCDLTQEKADLGVGSLKEAGISASGQAVDALSKDSLTACRDRVVEEHGTVDILVNLVGGNLPEASTTEGRTFFDLPIDAFEKAVAINLFGGAILPTQAFLELMVDTVAAYNVVDAMPDNLPDVKYPRTPGYRPESKENKFNAWYVKTEIKGATDGKLAGKTVVVKDNVCLAGVPMMVGASTLEGYVPDVDATIVTRILDAGGTIVGKAHCEYFCLSGSSHTNATGLVHNPWKMGHSAGGSSSGSAVLVATGEVDMAIGGDQGGSIRIPASFCGVYGMKATYGLVPYSGIMPIELTLDHTGPMTASVSDNALLLEVLAGADGLDPRQYGPLTAPYTEALGGGAGGLRIGVVEEGFGLANSDADVDDKVRGAAGLLAELGAE
ncbi:MAG: SDR family NAD(P)-dependent oxidoreductase, partial [Acidobacteria bacterium]|nr:SDR family NAD(P)-dependent oxidoreductase [Acidobacteriota bacterium]